MKLFANQICPSFCCGIHGLYHQILFLGLFVRCKRVFFFAESYCLSCYEQVIKYVFCGIEQFYSSEIISGRKFFFFFFYFSSFFFFFFFFFELVSLLLDSLFWVIVLQKKCYSRVGVSLLLKSYRIFVKFNRYSINSQEFLAFHLEYCLFHFSICISFVTVLLYFLVIFFNCFLVIVLVFHCMFEILYKVVDSIYDMLLVFHSLILGLYLNHFAVVLYVFCFFLLFLLIKIFSWYFLINFYFFFTSYNGSLQFSISSKASCHISMFFWFGVQVQVFLLKFGLLGFLVLCLFYSFSLGNIEQIEF